MKDFPMKQFSVMQGVWYMENKSYQLRYLPLFEQDLISTANYITNVLKNENAALRLIDDVMEVRRLMYGARDTDRHL